jgi:hypothetical protein
MLSVRYELRRERTVEHRTSGFMDSTVECHSVRDLNCKFPGLRYLDDDP